MESEVVAYWHEGVGKNIWELSIAMRWNSRLGCESATRKTRITSKMQKILDSLFRIVITPDIAATGTIHNACTKAKGVIQQNKIDNTKKRTQDQGKKRERRTI